MLEYLQNKVTDFVGKYRWFLVAQLIVIVCCGLWGLNSTKIIETKQNETENLRVNTLENLNGDKSGTMIEQSSQSTERSKEKAVVNNNDGLGFVDIKGAVHKPGIYQVLLTERIVDALKKAGGVTSDADLAQLNQASKVADEMVIYVPKKGENIKGMLGGTSVQSTEDALVNLNTASEQELMTLPGVGQKRAQDIIAYREDKGFQAVSDLGHVPGFGPKMLAKLEALVQV